MSSLSEFFEMYANGEKGGSLFTQPFTKGMFDGHSDPNNYVSKMFKTGDDRSKVLVAAMVSESFIDDMLGLLLPKYSLLLEDSNNFTFSTKIKLLESFEVVPRHLTVAADLIRRVRNEFAHNLHVDSLTQVKGPILDKLRTLYSQRKIRTDKGPGDISVLFDSIAFMATSWLNFYRVNIQLYAQAVREPQFLQALEDAHRKRLESEYVALKASLGL